jgi:hypothetical protein
VDEAIQLALHKQLRKIEAVAQDLEAANTAVDKVRF